MNTIFKQFLTNKTNFQNTCKIRFSYADICAEETDQLDWIDYIAPESVLCAGDITHEVSI